MSIKEIAKRSGFSASTVSRALNNDPRISQKTVTVIKKIAEQLNYTKDFAALNMNKDESNILAIIFPPDDLMAINNVFYSEIIKHAAYTANKHDYLSSVVMAENMQQLKLSVEKLITSGKVRKFILLFNIENNPIIEQLKQSGVKFVVIGNPNDEQVTFVDTANYEASQAAVEKALTKEMSLKPLFVMSAYEWQFEKLRYSGAKDMLRQQNTELIKINVDLKRMNLTAIDEQIKNSDLLIFSSDELLISVYGLINNHTLPRLVSFNHSKDIKLLNQQITSVDLNPRLMGERAAELLFSDKIEPKPNWIAFDLI